MRGFKINTLACFGLILFTFLFYARTLQYGFYFDDRSQILEGKLIQRWSSVKTIFTAPVWQNVDTSRSEQHVRLDTYRPLFNLSLLIDYQKGGLSPWTYHSSNLLFHALVTCFVYLIIVNFSASLFYSVALAFLFLIHPIVLTPVNYVSARADSLCALFTLMSIFFLIQARHREWNQPSVILLSAACYALALLCKETSILLPFMLLPLILSFDWTTYKKVITVGAYLITLLFYFYFRRHFLGASKVAADADHLIRVLVNYPWVILHFLKQLFWPTSIYPLMAYTQASVTIIHAATAIILYSLCISLYFFLLRKKTMAARSWPIFFSLGTLLPPMLAVVNTNVIDGHYLYMPFLGLVLLLGVNSIHFKKSPPKGVLTGIGILLILVAAHSFHLAANFRHEIPLYQAIVHTGRPAPLVYLNLGNSYARVGDWSLAAKTYESYEKIYGPTERILNNKGVALMNAGRLHEAEQTLLKGIEQFPQHAKNDYNLALVYKALGQNKKAIDYLTKALQKDPGYSLAKQELTALRTRTKPR